MYLFIFALVLSKWTKVIGVEGVREDLLLVGILPVFVIYGAFPSD